MNLLEYTKKLSEKIRFYDDIVKSPFFGSSNPFNKPVNFTIVWIEDEKEN